MYIERKFIFIAAGALVLILLGLGAFFLIRHNISAEAARIEQLRQNTIALAMDYLERGDFARALELLDRLLIENPNDEYIRQLRDEVLARRALAEAAKEFTPEELAELARQEEQRRREEEAQRLALEEQRLRLEEQRRVAAEADRVRREAEAVALAERRAVEAAAEAERRAAEAAAAEERRLAAEAEAERRRLQEEELARLSREKRAQMQAVLDLVSQGKNALARKDYPGAITIFDEARSRMPEDETAWAAQIFSDMAEAWYGAGDPQTAEGRDATVRAEALAIEAKGKDPSLALPYYTLGKIYRDRRQWDPAIAEMREAVRLDSRSFSYIFDLGRVYFSAGRFADARQAFETATHLQPNSESAWYNLGGSLRRLGRNDDALAAFRRAVTIRADHSLSHREIGRILADRGDHRGAIDAFMRALQYSPNDLPSLQELGASQSAFGNFAAAETSFNRALAAAPDDARTNYNMAVVKLELNKKAEALGYAQKAAAAEPGNASYAYTLGQAYEAVEDIERAITAYTNAIQLDFRYVKPRINMSKIFIEFGMFPEARNLLLDARQWEPSSFEVNNNLGDVYTKMEEWNSSIEYLEIAMSLDSSDLTVRTNLANAFVQSGKLSQAVDAYREVIRLSPTNWDAMFQLGKTYVSLGDSAQARRTLQDLIARNPSYSSRAEVERILAEL